MWYRRRIEPWRLSQFIAHRLRLKPFHILLPSLVWFKSQAQVFRCNIVIAFCATSISCVSLISRAHAFCPTWAHLTIQWPGRWVPNHEIMPLYYVSMPSLRRLAMKSLFTDDNWRSSTWYCMKRDYYASHAKWEACASLPAAQTKCRIIIMLNKVEYRCDKKATEEWARIVNAKRAAARRELACCIRKIMTCREFRHTRGRVHSRSLAFMRRSQMRFL